MLALRMMQAAAGARSVAGGDPTQRVLTISATQYNINVLTLHDSEYPPFTNADVSAGGSLKVEIADTAIIGSTSVDAFSLIIPTGWPVGLRIELHIDGSVVGKAGEGGDGGTADESSNTPGADGQDGGGALLVQFPVHVYLEAAGKIASGGGGGGGGGWLFVGDAFLGGGGGGAGAGVDTGEGGDGGDGSIPPTTQAQPGQSGTSTEGGEGGENVFSDVVQVFGGDGGDLGQPGSPGLQVDGHGDAGDGGDAGLAIDGISYITWEANDGSILGPTS